MKIFIDTKQDSPTEMQYVVALLQHVLEANGHREGSSQVRLPSTNPPIPQSRPAQEPFSNPLAMFDTPTSTPSYQSPLYSPPTSVSATSSPTGTDSTLGIFDVFKETPSQGLPPSPTPRETAEDLLRYDEEQEQDDEKRRHPSDFRLMTY